MNHCQRFLEYDHPYLQIHVSYFLLDLASRRKIRTRSYKRKFYLEINLVLMDDLAYEMTPLVPADKVERKSLVLPLEPSSQWSWPKSLR